MLNRVVPSPDLSLWSDFCSAKVPSTEEYKAKRANIIPRPLSFPCPFHLLQPDPENQDRFPTTYASRYPPPPHVERRTPRHVPPV